MPKKETVPWMVTDPPFPSDLNAEELSYFESSLPLFQAVCAALRNDDHCPRIKCRRAHYCVGPHNLAAASQNFFNVMPPCISGLTGLSRFLKAIFIIDERQEAEEEEFGYETAFLRACDRFWTENEGSSDTKARRC